MKNESTDKAPVDAEVPSKNPVKPEFVHLHLHTQYSLLEGCIHVEDLFDHVKKKGMTAVAITDSNNLFGAIDFYTSAKDAEIKPIIGCEVFVHPYFRPKDLGLTARGKKQNQAGRLRFHHLTILCKDLQGYQELCEVLTEAHLSAKAKALTAKTVSEKNETLDERGILDFQTIVSKRRNWVVLSGDIKSEISFKILTGHDEEALELISKLKETYQEDFYLECIDSSLPEQELLNQTLSEIGEKQGIRTVATSDCHYIDRPDGEAHEILQCIAVGKNLDFDRPKSLAPHDYYLKTPEEMLSRMSKFPGACEATLEIAEKCNVKFRFKDEKGRPIYHLPNFRPEGMPEDAPFDLIAYFKESSKEGLERRFASFTFGEKISQPDWLILREQYYERLTAELTMIEKTGFAGYFLIVADYIGWSRKNGIPVGPGRGSGAGSLVAYALGITDIDPIEFKLLFERFINPERISMPDFDVDFCQDRRGEVIEYVSRRYGADRVSQIITFGKLQARACLKDVGRVLGLTFQETDIISKLFPDELGITIKKAIDQESRLQERIDTEPKTAKLFDYALKLEGLYRNAGMHAAGVIITEKPIVNYCPIYVSSEGDVVTQFDKDFSEKVGLVKFDFLGLKTLTVIDKAIGLIRKNQAEGDAPFDIESISYRDPKVFELIASGDTDGVFQVESDGMKDLCIRLRPTSLDEITAINALYRPGPLGSGMVDDFIERKHGRATIQYELPHLEPILKETYGIMLYQEQVMQIARELAGYSLGQADLLRRAMGKKKAEEMASHRAIFTKGCTERGILAEKAQIIFDLMAKFADYGFNKSHSAAYGVITYQTAFLKTHFPSEFMAALMTTEMSNTDKLTKYIGDARSHHIKVLGPNVNVSERQFSVERESKAIRFGLEAIKGVGGSAVDAIIEARDKDGEFQDVIDFVERVSTRKVNKKVLESLVISGATDGIAGHHSRAGLLSSVENLLSYASHEQEERELGQVSMFDAFKAQEVKMRPSEANLIHDEVEWSDARKLQLEKSVVGFYLTGHPFSKWQPICDEWLSHHSEKLRLIGERQSESQNGRLPDPASGGGLNQTGPQANGQNSVGQSPSTGHSQINNLGESAKIPPAPPKPAAKGPDGGKPKFTRGGFGADRPKRPEAAMGGIISEIREAKTKMGKRFAFIRIEDLYGSVEVPVFPNCFAEFEAFLKQASSESEPVIVVGELEVREGKGQIIANRFQSLAEAYKEQISRVILKLDVTRISPELLRQLKQKCLEFPGKCNLKIEFEDSDFRTSMDMGARLRVNPTPEFVEGLRNIAPAAVRVKIG